MLRRYRAAGIDPLREPILTYPVLHYQNGGLVIDEHAETTLEGLYACGEIAGGTHGRNRMMGNSLLECSVFGRRAGAAAAEKATRMSTIVATDLQQRRRGRGRAPLRLGAEGHPAGPARRARRRRGSARPRCRASACSTRSTRTSRSPTTRRTSSARTPASPSTLPRRRALPAPPGADLRGAQDGTERATLEHPLRSNAVHTITRENTGPNIGYRLPIVHWEFIPDWDGLDVKCVPKGSGSENMSFLKMCVPADGVKGIKQFVLESIVGAGGKPCPPGIVGVGIGGSADYAMYLAKEAIARPIGTRNHDPHRGEARGGAVSSS